MRPRTLVWSGLWLLAGFVVAFAWVPGAASWSLGARIGLATAMFTFSALLLTIPLVTWSVRRKGAEEKGGCPVGATCACGHFNFKPRTTCKACNAATTYL